MLAIQPPASSFHPPHPTSDFRLPSSTFHPPLSAALKLTGPPRTCYALPTMTLHTMAMPLPRESRGALPG
jgi:hypothetical protein